MLRVAIIEDDMDQARLVASWLKPYSYQSRLFLSAEMFEEALKTGSRFDLLLIDWLLPGKSGFELLQELIKEEERPAIIFMTQLQKEEDLAQALHSGADDFLSKPLSQKVFVARLHAVIRRYQLLAAEQLLSAGHYELDPSHFMLTYSGASIKLTASEFRLMQLFSHSKGSVFTREELADSIWGNPEKVLGSRALELLISRLRKKLQQLPNPPGQIVNHYGKGYTFQVAT